MNDGDDNYNCFLSIKREKLRKTMCVGVGYITIFSGFKVVYIYSFGSVWVWV
jgi:hypothetical protein